MKIFAIETSCDETGIAYIDINKRTDVVRVLGETLSSQIDIHKEYGGVFPAVARREHAKIIGPLIIKTLVQGKNYNKTKKIPNVSVLKKIEKILEKEPAVLSVFLNELIYIKKPDIDYIGVTVGPGLEPALWVGISTSRALGVLWDVPVIPVNHMHGHIVSSQVDTKKIKSQSGSKIRKLNYPVLSLLVSGGHTELILSKKIGQYILLGKTRDDAAGECFDKSARMLGLPYPGGKEISKLASDARKDNIASIFTLPRPMIHSKDFDFSFSGLKTALLYSLRDLDKDITIKDKKSIAREVEESIVDVLVHKTIKAIKNTNAKTLIVGGGVSCNSWLQKKIIEKMDKNTTVHFPNNDIATDNGLMIAIATYMQIKEKGLKKRYNFKAKGKMSL